MTAFSGWLDSDLANVRDAAVRALLAALRRAREWPEAEPGRVEALAVENRVSGELRRRIAGAGAAAPAWARALQPALEARALSHGHANALRTEAAREAGLALQRRGIDAVAVKGLPLACTAYEEPGDRPFNDVDLLVRRAELAGAEEALLGAGYVRGKVETGPGASQDTFRRELPGVGLFEIDLHWALAGPRSLVRDLRPDEDGMRARSTAWAPGIRFPSREDALVMAAKNLVKWGFRPLGNILDFAKLLPGADAAAVIERARESRTATALSVALALAEVHFGAEVPARLALALPVPRWQRALLRRLLKAEDLARPELAEGVAARSTLKILSHSGVRGVARSLSALPGLAAKRLGRGRD